MKKASDPGDEVWTIARLIAWTSDYFEAHHIDSPRMTAEILLAFSLGISRIDLYLQYDKPLTGSELSCFKSLIKRRLNREPVAYITGTKGFWSFDLDVSPAVLVPRPDTECLVEHALEVIPLTVDEEPMTIIDLGTGSGAIVLALASDRPGHHYIGVDLSYDSACVARRNADRIVPDGRVSIINGNWMDMITPDPVFDVIVSNPPYIPRKDIEDLEPEVNRYEPMLALDGDDDGLSCLREIIEAAPRFLKDGGYLLMEMGFDQKDSVQRLFEPYSCYDQVEFFKDYAGNDRVVKARKIDT